MRQNDSTAALPIRHNAMMSPEELAYGIETLRHVIEQVRELAPGVARFGDAAKADDGACRVPDEVCQFHARREVVMTERHIRESIADIFGHSSPEARKHQNFRLNATTVAGIEEAVAALEHLIFQLEERRLRLVGARRQPAIQHAQHGDIHPLTDLYSRRLLDRYLAQEVERSRRYGHPCVLLFLSLRNWKAVHLAQGSSVGDSILVRMACACKAVLRGYDYAARIGEDEFAVVLPQSDSQGACVVSRRIAEQFSDSVAQLTPSVDLKVEFGMATFPFDGETPASLFYTAVTHRMSFTSDLSEVNMPL